MSLSAGAATRSVGWGWASFLSPQQPRPLSSRRCSRMRPLSSRCCYTRPLFAVAVALALSVAAHAAALGTLAVAGARALHSGVANRAHIRCLLNILLWVLLELGKAVLAVEVVGLAAIGVLRRLFGVRDDLARNGAAHFLLGGGALCGLRLLCRLLLGVRLVRLHKRDRAEREAHREHSECQSEVSHSEITSALIIPRCA
jgi:hypothetical protein